MSENFFVITGGPGGGKTTLLQALKLQKYACIEEGARQIIQDQVRVGGDAVPWDNIKRYKELLLAHALEAYQRALKNCDSITFFDRGILDLIAYDRRTKSETSEELYKAVGTLHYNQKVFVTPPWEEIFCNDEERKQTYEQAVEVYQIIVEVYTEYGFDLIELPKTSVSDRIDLISRSLF